MGACHSIVLSKYETWPEICYLYEEFLSCVSEACDPVDEPKYYCHDGYALVIDDECEPPAMPPGFAPCEGDELVGLQLAVDESPERCM